ncbi:hypothetical protein [Haloarcula montana]|uniref:hypothetical protein n=1 Tax=Haloarcula montana TaxID=3111776 RepID=UPI002D7A0A0A|nr:hypothetical protein [Haloarcula sp. GH36]
MYRRLALVLALAAAAMLTVSAQGFSSVSADRQVSVDVVGDEDAYMSLRYEDISLNADSHETVEIEFLGVSNHFNQPINFTVRYAVGSDGVDGPSREVETHEDVDIGESFDVSTTAECTPSDTIERTVSFDVQANGGSVFAETTSPRTVAYTVTCADKQTATGQRSQTDVRFNGRRGVVSVSGLGTDADRNATVWVLDGADGVVTQHDVVVPTNGRLTNNYGSKEAIAAVSLDATGEIYVHPALQRTSEGGDLLIGDGSDKPADPVCDGIGSPKRLQGTSELACPS